MSRLLSTLRTAGPWRALAVAAAAVVALLALRTAQLLGLAPLLYDPEFLQFSRLATDLQGELGWLDLGPRGILRDYIYMEFAQGTAWIAVGTALLSPILGVSVWSMHAVALLSEAAAVGVFALLLIRLGGIRAAAIGLLPWLLAPRFAVTWQLLPFGNHTEFLVFPLLVALLLTSRGRVREPLWPWVVSAGLLGIAVVAYRGNLPAVLALAGTALWSGSRRSILAGLGGVAAALLLACGFLVWVYGGEIVSGWPADDTLLPRIGGDTSVGALLGGLPRAFPGAPAVLGTALPYLALLALGLALSLGVIVRTRDARDRGLHARRFAVLWAFATAAATLLDGDPQPVHRLNALYAMLTATALLTATGVPSVARHVGTALLLVLGLAGLIDATGTIHPGAWRAGATYEGVELWQELRLRRVDGDDLPHFQRLVDEGRASRDAGRATHHVEGCSEPLRERLFGPAPAPLVSECSCEEDGALGRFLARDLAADPPASLEEVGRGVWIFCDRDLGATERALQGMDDETVGALMDGARDEASR